MTMTGTSLKQYRIAELIGRGGMGTVYRALDNKLGRQVAIKVLNPELTADPDRRTRFLQEARAAAALTHPAVAQVYDIDEVDGTMFIAMEFVDGRTVRLLIESGELDLAAAIEIALQTVDGLARAHDLGIIHRDIKPDNIMVTKDGRAKILDFGLAKLLDPVQAAPVQRMSSQTMTMQGPATIEGTVMGTLSYMSPEQARGKALDQRSDLFSFGIVLYQMVSGELPFKGETPIDTMHSIAYEEATPVTSLNSDLPYDLNRIIARCLRKKPEDRYPDAHALGADLTKLRKEIESGTATRLNAKARLELLGERLKASFPYGAKGLAISAAALFVILTLFIGLKINWSGAIGPAIIGLFIYRAFRNRKKRRVAGLVKKLGRIPEVRAILLKENTLVVALDDAPANVYIRITGLVDEFNRRLYFGKPVAAEIRESLDAAGLSTFLKQTGIAYIREDIGVTSSSAR